MYLLDTFSTWDEQGLPAHFAAVGRGKRIALLRVTRPGLPADVQALTGNIGRQLAAGQAQGTGRFASLRSAARYTAHQRLRRLLGQGLIPEALALAEFCGQLGIVAPLPPREDKASRGWARRP